MLFRFENRANIIYLWSVQKLLMDNKLEKLKTRWRRWLGNKTRNNRPDWTTLLESNYRSWADCLLRQHAVPSHLCNVPAICNRFQIKELFTIAISIASIDDLIELDILHVKEKRKL